MSDRFFRLILGLSLMFFLFFDLKRAMYVYICVLIAEGVSNWRIPAVISKLRFGIGFHEENSIGSLRFNFDGERFLRLLLASLLILSFVLFHRQLWFLPWFIGFALVMAGITGICPMAILLKKMGFR